MWWCSPADVVVHSCHEAALSAVHSLPRHGVSTPDDYVEVEGNLAHLDPTTLLLTIRTYCGCATDNETVKFVTENVLNSLGMTNKQTDFQASPEHVLAAIRGTRGVISQTLPPEKQTLCWSCFGHTVIERMSMPSLRAVALRPDVKQTLDASLRVAFIARLSKEWSDVFSPQPGESQSSQNSQASLTDLAACLRLAVPSATAETVQHITRCFCGLSNLGHRDIILADELQNKLRHQLNTRSNEGLLPVIMLLQGLWEADISLMPELAKGINKLLEKWPHVNGRNAARAAEESGSESMQVVALMLRHRALPKSVLHHVMRCHKSHGLDTSPAEILKVIRCDNSRTQLDEDVVRYVVKSFMSIDAVRCPSALQVTYRKGFMPMYCFRL
eukprot:jgi/Ulvmu1/7608/UM038_0033.1